MYCWKMSAEVTYSEISHFYPIVTGVSVVAVYILGLGFKMIYYKWYHPNLAKEELNGDTTERSRSGQGPTRNRTLPGDETDFARSAPEDELTDISYPCIPQSLIVTENIDTEVTNRRWPSPPAPNTKRCNKRMRKLAENFYS